MNFLLEPPEGIVDNSKMTPEQEATAIMFMDELISLGVLREKPPREV